MSKIGILGGGPAGLYCGLLLKKANRSHDVSIIERNAPDATYGWGVVFSDRTLASFQEADYKTYHAITNHFVRWDAIDIHYQGRLIRCGGHIFAGLARKQLLALLQLRCAELGVTQSYHSEVHEPGELEGYDLVIAADGVNSLLREEYASAFRPTLAPGKARFIWLGTTKILDAFTFIFRENEHGLFQVHAYPFSGDTGTFIVECDEETWLRAGLDHATEAESITYCEQLFAQELRGARLLPNNSKWTNFITVKNASWHHQNVVLLGDAAHTAHFSIGSGTKLAMEDAIALAHALEAHQDVETALADYEAVRKPVIEMFQAAAAESRTYFESVRRYTRLPPYEFSFNLLTRSGRVSYDDLRLRDPSFGDSVDRQFQAAHEPPSAISGKETPPGLISVPPVFTPLRLRSVKLSNRLVQSPLGALEAAIGEDGVPSPAYQRCMQQQALSGAGLVMTGSAAICRNGRVSPESLGAYAKTALAGLAFPGRSDTLHHWSQSRHDPQPRREARRRPAGARGSG